MLRYAFLRSDFHPQILILGERNDLRRLGAMLDAFAAGDADGRVIEQQHSTAPDTATRLILERHARATGAHPRAGDAADFNWCLDGAAAERFAAMTKGLATGNDAAGSVMLEIGAEGEIPIKVSLGEFTDDFLVSLS